jgi:MFS family permease
LGAYYWLHWLLQVPGGLLARRYGTKLVFGLGNLVPALLGFFIPYTTQLHTLIFLRVLQGLIAVSCVLVEIEFCYEFQLPSRIYFLHIRKILLMLFSSSGRNMAFDA